MRKRVQVISIALCAVIMLSLIGYLVLHFVHGATGNFPEPVSIRNPAQIYNDAVENTQTYNNLTLQIESIRHTVSSGQVFIEEISQSVIYRDIHSDHMTASVIETQSVGNHQFTVNECYANEMIYTDVEEGSFCSPTSSSAFRARYAPAVPINAELYGDITGLDTGSSYIILFQSPTDAEGWINNDININLSKTWAVANIKHDGTLTESTYYVSYTERDTIISRSITVGLDYTASEFDIPEDPTAYTLINHIDGPKNLEAACGYLLSSAPVSSQTNDTIFFEAYGDKRLQQINIDASLANDLTVKVETTRTLENASHTGEISTYKQTQIFENGIYRVAENDSDFKTDETIDQNSMRRYYQNLLVSTIMLPKYISGADVSVNNEITTITFTTTDGFADQIISNACQTLYQKPDLIATLESSHNLISLSAYIKIDTVTGFPVSSGISYSGTHNINNLNYQLQYTIDQVYNVAAP